MAQYTDEQNFNLADQVYENHNLETGTKIRLENDGKKEQWIVINSVNDPSGLQSIAVVPINDYKNMQAGKINSYPNVIFAGRGSETNLAEFGKDWIHTDGGTLGFGGQPDQLKETYGLNVSGDKSKPSHAKEWDQFPQVLSEIDAMVDNNQFLGMERFVNETLREFKISDYSFTGHSLGGALAQYMAVITDKNATTFAAARAYRLLPADLKKLVDSGYFNNKIKNYRHEFDPIGFLPGGKIIGLNLVAKSSGNAFSAHMRDSFKGQFKDGKMILNDKYKVDVKNRLTKINSEEKLAYSDLSALRKKLKTSGGGLSSNEQIFLDSSESLIAVSSLSQKVAISVEKSMATCKNAITDLEDTWNNILKAAGSIGVDLADYEILEALEAGGASKDVIVTEPVQKIEEKISEFESICEHFDQLINEILASIDQLVQTDKELAAQLN